MSEISEPSRWGCNHAICDNERIYSTGRRAQVTLKQGIRRTVPWIEAQVKAALQNEEYGRYVLRLAGEDLPQPDNG